MLDWIIAHRRGSHLGALQVTEANLETPLPLIDIVNECLEALVVYNTYKPYKPYNTASDMLDEHKLCANDTYDSNSKQAESCHNPATLFETVPQYSSPATPVAHQDAYVALKGDFSSPLLPYSQPLDVSRSTCARWRRVATL